MSRNGSGTYNLPAGNPVVTNTTISSTWANTTLTDIATALTGSLAADGQTSATGNLNMNINRIVNVVNPTSAQDAATKTYVDTADVANLALGLLKASNLSDVANATTSRTNLSAAKSGANSDITSITGLTTALTVAQGGTGVTTSTGSGANVLGTSPTISSPTITSPTISSPTITGNITDGTYTISVASTAQGNAKAWVNYKGTATRAINASFNVSSVTYNSTGSYTINFTNAFADANYASVGTCQTTASFAVVLKLATTGQTTSASNIITAYQSGSTGQDLNADSALICMAFFR
jgi:hypothetical protein